MPVSGGSSTLTGSALTLGVSAELVNLDTANNVYSITGPGITGTLVSQPGVLVLCPDGVSTAAISGQIASGTVANNSGQYSITGGIFFKPVLVTGALTKSGSNFSLVGTYTAGNPGTPTLAYFGVTIGSDDPITVPGTLNAVAGTAAATYNFTLNTPSGSVVTLNGYMTFRACNADSISIPGVTYTFVGYCTLADVLAQANRISPFTDTENTRAQAAIAQAMATIDRETGTWFDNRHVQVITETISEKQGKLFMPAPIISTTSLTEDDVALVEGDDADYLQYDEYFVKMKNAQNFLVGNIFNPWSMWSQNPQAIVFIGHLGYATVPSDIAQVCALMAGIYMGIIERTYTTPDGVVGAVRTLKLPEWAVETLRARTRPGYDYQPFIITAL